MVRSGRTRTATAGHYSGNIGVVLSSDVGVDVHRTVAVSFAVRDDVAYRSGDVRCARHIPRIFSAAMDSAMSFATP